MPKNKEYRIKLTHFNIFFTVGVVVIIAVSLIIATLIIGKIKRDTANEEGTSIIGNQTTTPTEEPTTVEIVYTAEQYYDLAIEKFDKGEYKEALNYAYNMLGMEIDNAKKEQILFIIADVYVADNNLRAAYYLLEDSGVEGLTERYCSEKVDLMVSLSKYMDPTDENYIYMGYYPQTGYLADELPEYVTETAFDNNNFARIYGVEYTRVKNGEDYEYFVSEPVRWWIIASTADTYTVISDRLIDCVPFNETFVSVTWDVSTLKTWTNEAFYNSCFNDDEKNDVVEHTTPASWNYYYQFTSGRDTIDKVGMIPAASLSDKTHVFMDHDSEASMLLRKSLVTDYAKAKGAFADEDGYGKWWTATSASEDNWYTITVTNDGIVLIVSGGEVVNRNDICARPYMTIKK